MKALRPLDDGLWRQNTGIKEILNEDDLLDNLHLKQIKKARYIIINYGERRNQDAAGAAADTK